MSNVAERYPFLSRKSEWGEASLFPLLPMSLSLGRTTTPVLALLDTAATVNVLPYDVGEQLGAVWEQQTNVVSLAGNLAKEEARGLLLMATIGKFPPIRLGFAWTKSNAIPVLLGQINFFMEFDVCFFRSQSFFELKPK